MKHDENTHQITYSKYPVCGYEMDAATELNYGPDKSGPSAGDLSLCFKCGEVLIFNEDWSLREASIDDMLKFTKDQMDHIEHAQKMIRELRLI